MFRKVQLCVFLLLFAAFGLAACSGSGQSSITPPQNLRVLTDPSFYDPISLSPYTRAGEGGLGRLLWAPLIGQDSQWHFAPNGLAQSYDVSQDGKTYTFHLRQNAKYSDGTPITAQDVDFSLRYDIMTGHPKVKGKGLLGNTATRFYSNIVGAQAVFNGDVPADEFGAAPVAGVTAPDASTLQIQLVQADPNFLVDLMDSPPSAVKPADIERGEGKNYTNNQYWTTDPAVAYSGSFKLESYTPNQGMTLVPNPDFWGQKPALQKITATFISDHSTAITAFENKQADWLDMPLSATDVQTAKTDPYLQSSLVAADSYNVQQLWITSYAPMDDVHVRRAIAMAINHQTLVNVLGGGSNQTFYKPIIGHIANPNSCPSITNALQPLSNNAAAAQAELAQSKYGSAVKNMQINIVLGLFGQDASLNRIEAQFIQQALQSTLGFTNVQIRTDPINDINHPPFPVQLWMNNQGDVHPNLYRFLNNMASLIPSQPYNQSQTIPLLGLPYVPQITAEMNTAFAAPTQQQQCQDLGKVLQTWIDQVESIDLFTETDFQLVAPDVKNLHMCCGVGGNERLWLTPGIENTSLTAN